MMKNVRLLMYLSAQFAFVTLIVLITLIGVLILSDEASNEALYIEAALVIAVYPVYKIACKTPKKK